MSQESRMEEFRSVEEWRNKLISQTQDYKRDLEVVKGEHTRQLLLDEIEENEAFIESLDNDLNNK
ncbi:hypothetical protein GJU40_16655 [Bacillus lacus]|uniref:Uncharacterized protein n=1 Tax=Metabacillus lacus TaxID=1983721 RepID=A0A7X2M169_9BACI|nr:hypothetical protein [Metabacillus lacus]MRX73774.1 hypothetical protein [Metabacillus lacus]